MKRAVLLLLAACGGHHAATVKATAPTPLPEHTTFTLDAAPQQHRRMVQPEVFVRAYLHWFGGLAPLEVQQRAQRDNLFDQWKDYLNALGLADYKIDLPRTPQSNTIMLATVGRIAEALCIRAVEHDLVAAPPLDQRLIFAFDEKAAPSLDEFTSRFDVLHRTFLSYPASLAPGRAERFYALFQDVASRHEEAGRLSPERTAWAAVCVALVQHPETELY